MQFDVFYKNVLSYFHPKIINIRKYFNFVIVEIIILLLLFHLVIKKLLNI